MPTYQHDCKVCIFLATIKVPDNWDVDLYYHPEVLRSLIVRHSSEPSDYTSGLPIAAEMVKHQQWDQPLATAYLLADGRGLLTDYHLSDLSQE